MLQNKLMNSPRLLLSLGVILMLLGIALPFLMVIQVLGARVAVIARVSSQSTGRRRVAPRRGIRLR